MGTAQASTFFQKIGATGRVRRGAFTRFPGSQDARSRGSENGWARIGRPIIECDDLIDDALHSLQVKR
jgi:hypothetical protein